MEHILQFAINIDDDTIKKNVEAKAEKQIIDQLAINVKSSIVNKWGSLTSVAETVIRDVMEEHKDEIIKLAADSVAESIKRSKKYREALANIVEEMNDDR